MKKNYIKTFLLYAFLIVAVILAVSFMFSSAEEEKITYSDVVEYFKNDEVIEFVVDDEFFITMTVDTLDAEGNPSGNKKNDRLSVCLRLYA